MRRNPWLTLAVLAFAQFMVLLDVTIVNVALPSIQSGLGFSADGLQWVVSGYTLMFGGFLLLGGQLADLLGRRRIVADPRAHHLMLREAPKPSLQAPCHGAVANGRRSGKITYRS